MVSRTAACARRHLYLPNGNPIGTDKFDYKLAWMERLEARTRELLADEEPFVLPATSTSSPSR